MAFWRALWLCAAAVAALPAIHQRAGLVITPSQIVQISPASSSCANPPVPGECKDADQAAGPITQSLATYKITNYAEAAAVISLMAFETGDFKYDKNHYPGTPGQGTRNMQMIPSNLRYAGSIPQIQSNLTSIVGTGGNAGSITDTQKNAVVSLLNANDDIGFGSGAWYLATECSDAIRSALQSGTDAGWSSYITSCVGTTVTEERKAYWTRAIQVLKPAQ